MLFVIVLAVFWVIGGIIKATAKKPQDRQTQQPPARKPVRQARPVASAREAAPARPSRMEQACPQPASYPVEIENAFLAKIAQATGKLESALPSIPAGPIVQDISDYTDKPVSELEEMRLDVPHQISEAEDLPELVLDYSDSDELSRAILHYEILGPPVSLRDPTNQITDL
jgi:hypothetical protein